MTNDCGERNETTTTEYDSNITHKLSQQTQDREFFSFPYEPYDIQLRLMQQIWRTLDDGHVGIYESPTGTGKSMSLICGALTWLVKNTDECGLLLPNKTLPIPMSKTMLPEPKQPRSLPTSAAPPNDTDASCTLQREPTWLLNAEKSQLDRLQQQCQSKVQEALREIAKIRKQPKEESKKRKIAMGYRHYEHKRGRGSRTSLLSKAEKGEMEAGNENLVDAYNSSEERLPSWEDSEEMGKSMQSSRRLYERPEYDILKIIYCSRTHSQIAQFIREIRKTVFANSIRVVTLGSRKNLCIHEAVKTLSSDVQMNDKCLDMMQDTSSTRRCQYYDRQLLDQYKNYALATVQDIEELQMLGSEMTACSYYGTRESIPLAQIVAMPYSMLVSKDTRESLGIKVDGQIVVVDEAHNIMDAIYNNSKVEVRMKHLVQARRSLWAYFQKFEKRFKGSNSFYIKQLLTILEYLTKFLKQTKSSMGSSNSLLLPNSNEPTHNRSPKPEQAASPAMMTITDFLFAARMDHFNLFKLLQYLKHSGLSKKLLGYMEIEMKCPMSQHTATDSKSQDDCHSQTESSHASPLRAIESLLKALTYPGDDGRLIAQPHQPSKGMDGMIKFILLNPSASFDEIVQLARSVILVGGTMQPVEEVVDQLFSCIPSSKIDLFSCGHVIPPQNLIGFTLSSGPTDKHLEFTYARRSNIDALDELGRILVNLSRIVPHGIVVFFPSYRFQADAFNRWQSSGTIDKIQQRKAIFREPKSTDQLDHVLAEYSAACRAPSGQGAALFSVVGGKMSEGINFSDELARCVVMVGMPYPNARDSELIEKMAYLEKSRTGSGREYYENICMKAVNQSIGRSIRHKNDFAAILLVDHRYSYPSSRNKLPSWIQKRTLVPSNGFGQVYSQLIKFYQSK